MSQSGLGRRRMALVSKSVGIRVVALMASVAFSSCQSVWQGPPQRIDFTPLKQADHIRVCGRSCYPTDLMIIDDSEKVRAAATFIERYSDGWRDSWNGPGGGALNLFFYQGQRLVGSYGMTPFDDSDVLMSVGRGSRRVSAHEVAMLIGRLGVQWPRPGVYRFTGSQQSSMCSARVQGDRRGANTSRRCPSASTSDVELSARTSSVCRCDTDRVSTSQRRPPDRVRAIVSNRATPRPSMWS